MDIDYRDSIVGVFGHPVAENPTVVMMEAAFRDLGLAKWRYLTIDIEIERLEEAIMAMRTLGFKGINLTMPHKVSVLPFLDSLTPTAEAIGAVNTVYIREGELIGENTDGKGFLRSLTEDSGIDPSGKEATVLGAGGASRAICMELALAGCSRIRVINRNVSRGETLVKRITEKTSARAEFMPWTEKIRIPEGTEILVNATSVGLYPKVDEKPDIDYETVNGSMIVCDVIPNPPRTPFLGEGEARDAVCLDGLGMLVYQGIIALSLWTGREADPEVMKRALLGE